VAFSNLKHNLCQAPSLFLEDLLEFTLVADFVASAVVSAFFEMCHRTCRQKI